MHPVLSMYTLELAMMMGWSPYMHWLVAFFALYALCLPFSSFAQAVCNGHAELCNRKYSNITQIGAHNSAFVGDLPQHNQDISVTDQLNKGIRFLQSQTQVNIFKVLSLCHTSCFLEDAGPAISYLSTIKTWLDSNPNEVVTILLTNGDNVDASMFNDAFTLSGLRSYTYIPPVSPLTLDAWPTLQEMISAGTRLVALLDYGADEAKFPYILDEFAYFFETPYNTLDPNFPQCTIDRPPNASPDGRMYIVNHYLDIEIAGILIPDRGAAGTTNSATSIGAQVAICEGLYNRAPVGVLVDYFDSGDVFTAQKDANGL